MNKNDLKNRLETFIECWNEDVEYHKRYAEMEGVYDNAKQRSDNYKEALTAVLDDLALLLQELDEEGYFNHNVTSTEPRIEYEYEIVKSR